MKALLALATAVAFCFTLFVPLTLSTAINGASHAIARAIPAPVEEPPAVKPPPEIVPAVQEPKPQPVDPTPEQNPGSSRKTWSSIKSLLKTKVLYPIQKTLKISNRPRNGMSAVVYNVATKKTEFVVGWKDMISAWETGRGVDADPTKTILTDFPIIPDPQRFADRDEALERLQDKEDFPYAVFLPISSDIIKARATEGIKYTMYLAQAKEQALRDGQGMTLVRLGMPKSVAANYKPYGTQIIAPPSAIKPGDPGWKQSMYNSAFGYKYGFARIPNYKQLKVTDPSVDPYIIHEFDPVDWNPPPRPPGYRAPEIGPKDEPPINRAKRRGLVQAPSLNQRQIDLGRLSADSSNSSSSDNILADEAAQFALFYEAFQAVQRNISTLVFPFLQTMVNNSNATIVYHAAWSIWADLTLSEYIIDGPFCNGLNRVAEIEDQYAQANNLSTSSEDYKAMLALDGILIAKYEIAWNNSLQAVNSSGLLDLRDSLADNLQVNGTGIESADFTTLDADTSGIDWFVQYDVPANASTNSTSQS